MITVFPEKITGLVICDAWNAWWDNVLKINEIMLYAICMRTSWYMNMKCYCGTSEFGKINPWLLLESNGNWVPDRRRKSGSSTSAGDGEPEMTILGICPLFMDILPRRDSTWEQLCGGIISLEREASIAEGINSVGDWASVFREINSVREKTLWTACDYKIWLGNIDVGSPKELGWGK